MRRILVTAIACGSALAAPGAATAAGEDMVRCDGGRLTVVFSGGTYSFSGRMHCEARQPDGDIAVPSGPENATVTDSGTRNSTICGMGTWSSNNLRIAFDHPALADRVFSYEISWLDVPPGAGEVRVLTPGWMGRGLASLTPENLSCATRATLALSFVFVRS